MVSSSTGLSPHKLSYRTSPAKCGRHEADPLDPFPEAHPGFPPIIDSGSETRLPNRQDPVEASLIGRAHGAAVIVPCPDHLIGIAELPISEIR